jgi:predicted pyridoxine 5'-phosphate oxidase superfamily flavin-nucleotide-binding protein
LLFVIPGVDETLRINGTAQLRDEPAFTDLFTTERQRPKLVIEVRVAEAYLHCSKAFMRSRLWKADAQVERTALPTMGQMIHDQMGLATAPESQSEMLARYQAQLDEEQVVGRAA